MIKIDIIVEQRPELPWAALGLDGLKCEIFLGLYWAYTGPHPPADS